jgi:hypothetical protein
MIISLLLVTTFILSYHLAKWHVKILDDIDNLIK